MRRIICFMVVACLSSGALAEGLFQGTVENDTYFKARVDAVDGCFVAAQTVSAAKACVGVSVPGCREMTPDADDGLCLMREAGTWQGMAFMSAMNIADRADVPKGETREGFAATIIEDALDWTVVTRGTCGVEPDENLPETWANARCWAEAAAQRAFILVRTEDL